MAVSVQGLQVSFGIVPPKRVRYGYSSQWGFQSHLSLQNSLRLCSVPKDVWLPRPLSSEGNTCWEEENETRLGWEAQPSLDEMFEVMLEVWQRYTASLTGVVGLTWGWKAQQLFLVKSLGLSVLCFAGGQFPLCLYPLSPARRHVDSTVHLFLRAALEILP